jgi:hypothetical protein
MSKSGALFVKDPQPVVDAARVRALLEWNQVIIDYVSVTMEENPKYSSGAFLIPNGSDLHLIADNTITLF